DTLTLVNGAILDFALSTTSQGTSHASPGISSQFAITNATDGSLVFPAGGTLTLNATGTFPTVTSGSTAYYELFSYLNGGTLAVSNFTGQSSFTISGQSSGNSIQLGSGFNAAYTYTLVNDATN